MSISILDTLENADYNLAIGSALNIEIAKEQLHNAVVLLSKGYNIYSDVHPLLAEYKDVMNVPDLEDI